MPRILLVALLLALPCLAWGSGGKRKALLITVHLETDASEGPKFSFNLPVPGSGESRAFKKSAEITDSEVEWFYLFPAESGNGYGAAFKFDSVGTNRLEYISTSNQGRHLLTIVHPAASSFVRIDKVISDGIIVVWEGLNDGHIVALRENLKERTAAAEPAPTAEPSDAPATPEAPGETEAPGSVPPPPEKKGLFKLFRKSGS